MDRVKSNPVNKEQKISKSHDKELGEVHHALRKMKETNLGYNSKTADKELGDGKYFLKKHGKSEDIYNEPSGEESAIKKDKVVKNKCMDIEINSDDGKCKQIDKKSDETSNWLFSLGDMQVEGNKNQEEKKKDRSLSISEGKQMIELLEERVMMLQFITNLRDDDFFRFVSKLEVVLCRQDGFTKTLMEDLDVETSSVPRVTEVKDKKKKLKVNHKGENNDVNSRDVKLMILDGVTNGALKNKALSDKAMSSTEETAEGRNFNEISEQVTFIKKRSESLKYDQINSELELLSSRKRVEDEEFEIIYEEEVKKKGQNDPYKPLYKSCNSYGPLIIRIFRRFCPCVRLKLEVKQRNHVNGVKEKEIDDQENQVVCSHEKQKKGGSEARKEGSNCQEKQVEEGNGARIALNQENNGSEKYCSKIEEKTKLFEEEGRMSEQEIQKEEKSGSEKNERKFEEEIKRKKRTVCRLLKMVLEKNIVTPGKLDKLVQIARDAGLPEENISHLTKRPVIPSLQKLKETLELGK